MRPRTWRGLVFVFRVALLKPNCKREDARKKQNRYGVSFGYGYGHGYGYGYGHGYGMFPNLDRMFPIAYDHGYGHG